MKSSIILTILLLLPFVGAVCSFLLKETYSRMISVVIACLCAILSILATAIPSYISTPFLNIETSQAAAAPLLLISIGLLIFIVATNLNSNKIGLVFLATISLMIETLAATTFTFAFAQISSIILLSIALDFKPKRSLFLLFLSSIFLITSTLPIPGSALQVPQRFILTALPLILISGIFPFHSWLEDATDNEPSASGLLFTLGILPIFAIAKFIVPTFEVGAALFASEISIIILILMLCSIILTSNQAISFCSIILLGAISLAVLPPINSELLAFYILGCGIGVIGLFMKAFESSFMKKWLFMGLPGSAVFPPLLFTTFVLTQSHPFLALALLISIAITFARSKTLKNLPSKPSSRLSLARTILLVVTLVIGLYPYPWLKFFGIEKTNTIRTITFEVTK